jgi:outer membrane receptor protein involved in Fe transport
MGMEVSEVSQSGDAEKKRNFHFFKPHASLTYSSDQDEQTRLRLSREVSQLTLTDFVSATVFEDDDLALGNPDLRPETTWAAEFGYERRFDAISVIKITTFYNWINGVLDLLPLSADFEAPGNIGNGKRWGVEFEGTAPLEWTGLHGAKLNLRLRWQDSTVEDPVTGIKRILSGENGQSAYRTLTNRNRNNHYFIGLDFRQDLEQSQVAWGWTVAERDKRPLYRVNELDIYHEDMAMDAFIETTRWFDLKIRLDAVNITDDEQERDRTVYTGLRDLSPVDFRLLNDRQIGRRLVLSVSGNF